MIIYKPVSKKPRAVEDFDSSTSDFGPIFFLLFPAMRTIIHETVDFQHLIETNNARL